MDYDNPAGGGGWGVDDQSDFTDSEKSGKEKKEKHLLGSSKKKDKEKKKEKEKETKYNQLGAESSNDEDDVKGSGKSKKKAFKIGLAKKDKKEKKEKESKEKDSESKEKEEKKKEKKEKKDKSKLKLKKSQKTGNESDKTAGAKEEAEANFPPVFGVPLETSVERSKCHDDIRLPVVVRECVDYIEAEGLTVEGIYRSSGVKSKIAKLKAAYNNRQPVKLCSYEPAVVASLLKLFLRELPEPVLTTKLGARWEEVAQARLPGDRRDGMVRLLAELPECNRVLVQWVFVHMGHVIAQEKMNKMTLQNVSIVLSPTMRISHRVLNCIFEHHGALFSGVRLTRYIPPMGDISQLPDSPRAIETEMRKQESLLAELHSEISSGVAVSKAREEQLWEQQRIVTQLKRNLRQAKSAKTQPPAEQDYEEELNFALQTPIVPNEPPQSTSSDPKQAQVVVKGQEPGVKEVTPVQVKEVTPVQVKTQEAQSSPEEGQEHRVTVQVHRDTASSDKDPVPSVKVKEPERSSSSSSEPPGVKEHGSAGHVTVIQLNQATTQQQQQQSTTATAVQPSREAPALPPAALSAPKMMPPPPSPAVVTTPSVRSAATSVSSVTSSGGKRVPSVSDQVDSSKDQSNMTEPSVDMTQTSPNSTQQFASQVVSFSSPILSTKAISSANNNQLQQLQTHQSKIPLLPPPPPSSKPKVRQERNTSSRPPVSGSQGGLLPPENKLKSKSLPRGLPSDGTVYNDSVESQDKTEDSNNVSEKESEEKVRRHHQKEALVMEELRLKFEYEELMTMKSELERKKRTERREIAELQEEIATMQTLYQYRTYSVDSSEEDSDPGEQGETREHRAQRLQLLASLGREKRDLEEKKMALGARLAEERAACLRLRVSIRLEHERIKRQKLSQFPGIGFGKPNLMD